MLPNTFFLIQGVETFRIVANLSTAFVFFFELGDPYPKKGATPASFSPKNSPLFEKVAIGDYAASNFGTMSMEARRDLKISELSLQSKSGG